MRRPFCITTGGGPLEHVQLHVADLACRDDDERVGFVAACGAQGRRSRRGSCGSCGSVVSTITSWRSGCRSRAGGQTSTTPHEVAPVVAWRDLAERADAPDRCRTASSIDVHDIVRQRHVARAVRVDRRRHDVDGHGHVGAARTSAPRRWPRRSVRRGCAASIHTSSCAEERSRCVCITHFAA